MLRENDRNASLCRVKLALVADQPGEIEHSGYDYYRARPRAGVQRRVAGRDARLLLRHAGVAVLHRKFRLGG
jgi:hypothetical protein